MGPSVPTWSQDEPLLSEANTSFTSASLLSPHTTERSSITSSRPEGSLMMEGEAV